MEHINFVHGHHLNCSDLPAQYSGSEKIDACLLNLLLAWLDKCTVCPGHPDEHYFFKMLESRGGKITSQHDDDIISILDNYAPITQSGKCAKKL